MADWTEAIKALERLGMEFVKPKRPTEAQIVAELYHRLRNEKILAYLEYPIKTWTEDQSQNGRIDLIVVKNGIIRCAIEAKRSDELINFEQLTRYSSLAVPIIFIGKWEQIDAVVGLIKYKFWGKQQPAKVWCLINGKMKEIQIDRDYGLPKCARTED